LLGDDRGDNAFMLRLKMFRCAVVWISVRLSCIYIYDHMYNKFRLGHNLT